MNKNDLIGRWHIVSNFRTAVQRLTGLGSAPGRTRFVAPGTETVDGRADCRGFKSEGKSTKKVEFRDLDFTFASFAHSRIEDSFFLNCLFVNADFSDFRDHGNRFERCKFVSVKFNGAYIGYRGSEFLDCRFEQCKFAKTLFIRAEFTDVDFVNCRLRGIDFDASSFENCSFSGELRDVWFRGGFALPDEEQRFGKPRPNKMENVSFEHAELSDLTFSDNCDLSTVRIDQTGKVFIVDKITQRLKRMKVEILSWKENEQKSAENLIFALDRKEQDWTIISLSDVERDYGTNTAAKIIASLSAEFNED